MLIEFLKNLNGGHVVEIFQNGYSVYVGLVRNALLFADEHDIIDHWFYDKEYRMVIVIK